LLKPKTKQKTDELEIMELEFLNNKKSKSMIWIKSWNWNSMVFLFHATNQTI